SEEMLLPRTGAAHGPDPWVGSGAALAYASAGSGPRVEPGGRGGGCGELGGNAPPTHRAAHGPDPWVGSGAALADASAGSGSRVEPGGRGGGWGALVPRGAGGPFSVNRPLSPCRAWWVGSIPVCPCPPVSNAHRSGARWR